jgi:predicted Zn-dependent protease
VKLVVAVALAVAGCGGNRFLGAPLPSSCKRGTLDASTAGEHCIGWIFDRLDVIATDDEYDDPALRAYVAGVGRRIARANGLPAPTVRIVDRGTGTAAYARPGGYVVLSRQLLALLANEAELAGVIAHEMVHDAAGHAADLADAYALGVEDTLKRQRSRDDESAADELAVRYLAAAGYDPDAMRTAMLALERAAIALNEAALAREAAARAPGDVAAAPEADAVSGADPLVLPVPAPVVDDRHRYPRAIDEEDPYHPALAERLGRIALMARGAGRRGGELGTDRYRARVDGLVVGIDPRRGTLDGTTWSAARLGLAVDLPPSWHLEDGAEKLEASATKHEATVWAIGRVWGDAVAATLDGRRRTTVAGHRAVVGTARAFGGARRTELEIAMDAPRPASGSEVAVITVGTRALAIYVHGADAPRELASLLARVRAMTDDERAAAVPERLRFVSAPREATAGELQSALCTDPDRVRWLEDQSRRATSGDAVKCVEK